MRFAPKLAPLFALSGVLGAFALMQGCGAGRACTGCVWKTGTYTVTPQQMPSGSKLVSAVMHTDIDHPSCPYDSGSPCSARLDVDVACKTTGPGSPVNAGIVPNGMTSTSTATSWVELKVDISGTQATFNLPVTYTSPTANRSPTSGPCGGGTDPTVTSP